MRNKQSKFEKLMANLEKAMSDHNKAIQTTQQVVAEYTKLQEQKQTFMATLAIPHTIE
jgi:uncharacterized coiled-coil protein SlyX